MQRTHKHKQFRRQNTSDACTYAVPCRLVSSVQGSDFQLGQNTGHTRTRPGSSSSETLPVALALAPEHVRSPYMHIILAALAPGRCSDDGKLLFPPGKPYAVRAIGLAKVVGFLNSGKPISFEHFGRVFLQPFFLTAQEKGSHRQCIRLLQSPLKEEAI